MLADDIQDPKNQTFSSDDTSLRRMISTSHRFVLDEEATRLCVDVAAVGPEELARILPLARLPYERIWIEVPRGIKMDQQFKHGTMSQAPEPCHPDSKIGYYIERDGDNRWRVSISEHSVDGPKEYMGWPIGFVVDISGNLQINKLITTGTNNDIAVSNMIDDTGTARLELESTAMIWGYHPDNTVGLTSMNNCAGITIHPSYMGEIGEDVLISMVQELSGTTRFLVAMLSTITCVPVEYVDVIPKGTRLINRKPKAKFKYRIPKIMLPKRKPKNPGKWARAIIHAEAKRMRRHFVKGHWRTYSSGHKSWVHEHERGDIRLGHVGSLTQVRGRK